MYNKNGNFGRSFTQRFRFGDLKMQTFENNTIIVSK